MRIVALGDSVMWGQGLLPEQKFVALVNQGINGDPPVDSNLTILAHSGAIIGAATNVSGTAVDGEVPMAYPTVIQQCDSFSDNPLAVDIVIVNGGINDVDGNNIVDPLVDEYTLRTLINQHCYQDMLTLLTHITSKFSNPNTKIVVPSYYPILSEQSDLIRIPPFLELRGIFLTELLTKLGDVIFDTIFEKCQLFSDLSSVCLRQAVNETNQALGRNCVRFAQVPFGTDNAGLAPNAWLWGVDVDSEPEDPMAAPRHASCDLYQPNLFKRELCYRASAGHPNILGAQQFAGAIMNALQN